MKVILHIEKLFGTTPQGDLLGVELLGSVEVQDEAGVALGTYPINIRGKLGSTMHFSDYSKELVEVMDD